MTVRHLEWARSDHRANIEVTEKTATKKTVEAPIPV